MPISKRRRRKLISKIFAKTFLMSSKNSCTTAEAWHLPKIPTTDTSSVSSKDA